MNPNYVTINVADQLEDKDSIYHFYKKMIQVRKENPVFVYGEYDVVQEEHPDVYVYTRALNDQFAIVLCNFREYSAELTLKHLPQRSTELILYNYKDAPEQLSETISLNPYEVRVYLYK